jgi:hypothetical protein
MQTASINGAEAAKLKRKVTPFEALTTLKK